MEIPLYLAMTAAEFHASEVLPPHPAWMACHFSCYGTGISNLPRELPAEAMLMLNDRTPICGHDPQDVAKSLCDTAQRLKCDSIALDFQREDQTGLTDVIRAVLDRAHCPVGVSVPYAEGFDCPVLAPPIDPHVPPQEALARWKGRELWLELSAGGTQIAVTEAGSRYTPLPHYLPGEGAHYEPLLHCHYEIIVEDDRILFNLGRTEEDRISLQNAVKALGVTRTVALWQEVQR